jgi:hypothetical protein
MLFLACAAPAGVHTEYDHDTDFGRYRAYAWTGEATPPAEASSLDQQVTAAVNQELLGRGFRRSSQPDLHVVYRILRGAHAGAPPDSGEPGPGTREGAAAAARTTLVLDFLDAKSKRRIWRGWTALAREDETHVRSAVQGILAEFPPGGHKRPPVRDADRSAG